MSTGLTYVSMYDYTTGSPDQSWCVVFNDYSEGKEFADWQSRFATPSTVYVMIWTASPNQNGYYSNGSFSSFD